jgi:hypothetical protein
MAGASPVPLTTVTEDNIDAQVLFDPQFEFV